MPYDKSKLPMVILGLYGDNGNQNGHYYSILGLNGGNGKEMETTIMGNIGFRTTSR